MADAPEIMNPPNLTPVIPVPSKEPSQEPGPIVTTQTHADATDAKILSEAPPQNDALPSAFPGSTAGGAPSKPANILSGPIVKAPGAAAPAQGVPMALVSRPARKPVDPTTAKSKALSVSNKPAEDSASETQGVWFTKNRFNENVILPNGKIYKFKKTREQVTDPAIISGLRSVAKKYDIFENTPAPATPAEPAPSAEPVATT